MTVDCGIDRQMMLLIETHRDSREASAPEELSDFLRRGRRWPLWIDVDHLSRAIDDHSKLGHLMRSEQAIQVRSTNFINIAFVCDGNWHVRESTISHHQGRELAHAVAFWLPPPHAP